MDKIILGYLMIRGMSAYDLKSCIRKNLSSMCSASSGSIYTALKKLLDKGFIGEKTLEDDRHDKKMYFITAPGREDFLQWLRTPMSLEKAKNMEFAKMFFGGIQENDEQITSLKEYVNSLEKELETMLMIQKIQNNSDKKSLERMQKYLVEDVYNVEGIKALDNQNVSYEMIQQIYRNQMRTLEYGIAELTFQINWYKKTIEELKEERI